jgi:hypothetical protein
MIRSVYMKRAMYTLMGFLVLMLFFCTPIPPGQGEPPADLAESEKDFDPLAQDAERPIVISSGGEDGGQMPASTTPDGQTSISEDLSGPERPGVARGYRVQIFLSDDLREASRVMAEARERFEQEVYLEYDAPYYKVRVGDCSHEWQGEELLQVARRLGYPDAWLVRTIIRVPGEQESPGEEKSPGGEELQGEESFNDGGR